MHDMIELKGDSFTKYVIHVSTFAIDRPHNSGSTSSHLRLNPSTQTGSIPVIEVITQNTPKMMGSIPYTQSKELIRRGGGEKKRHVCI